MGVDKAITTNTVQPRTFPRSERVNIVKGEPIIMGAGKDADAVPSSDEVNAAFFDRVVMADPFDPQYKNLGVVHSMPAKKRGGRPRKAKE